MTDMRLTLTGIKPVAHDDVVETEGLLCGIGAALNDLCNLPISGVVKARIVYMGTEISAEEAIGQLLLRMMTMKHFAEGYRLENER
ncbi:MAG: hypothetical protein KGJ13_12620 [Patescibacteria group bacterium]|nr:hypothetical protein [Patescibacteria group bacterium]